MKLIRKLFIYSHLAWIWLGLTALHILLTNSLPADHFLLKIMNQVVFFSSFLVYSVSSNIQGEREIFVSFAIQFSFWLVISLVNTFFIMQVNKYANRR